MSYFLHIDTSGDKAIVGISKEGTWMMEKSSSDQKSQASQINMMIHEVLTETHIGWSHIAAIAVIGGPGSYTGLRIGLATAKGFCYALEKPLMMHNLLEIILDELLINNRNKNYDLYMVVLPAREKEYFILVKNKQGAVILPPQHIHDIALRSFIKNNASKNIITTHSLKEAEFLFENLFSIKRVPGKYDKNLWAALTAEAFKNQQLTDIAQATPYYLKEVFTTSPKKNRLL